jgi:hypothetical protein
MNVDKVSIRICGDLHLQGLIALILMGRWLEFWILLALGYTRRLK